MINSDCEEQKRKVFFDPILLDLFIYLYFRVYQLEGWVFFFSKAHGLMWLMINRHVQTLAPSVPDHKHYNQLQCQCSVFKYSAVCSSLLHLFPFSPPCLFMNIYAQIIVRGPCVLRQLKFTLVAWSYDLILLRQWYIDLYMLSVCPK